MNNVILMGRLTKDPELKTTQSGLSFCRFTVAVDRYSKDGEDKTNFISCVAWRNTAEFIDKYFSKGQRILLSGSIQTGSYTDKDGRTVYTTDVLVDKAEFCESKKNSDNDKPAPTRAREPKETEDIALDISEDLPF